MCQCLIVLVVHGYGRGMRLGTCLVYTTCVVARDVLGKEREKPGKGKKLERTLFFSFPFSNFLTTFFPFLAKIVKNGRKECWDDKKRLERCGTAKNGHSTPFQIVESSEIPFFMLFKTSFCPSSNPFFTPFQTRS